MCVSFFVCGSYICRWRLALLTGNTFADGCVDPALQRSGLSDGLTADVSHRRPFSSSIGLCTLFLLVQIDLVVPVWRRCRHCRVGRRRLRIAHRQRNPGDRVANGIEHWNVIGAELERAVDQSVRVDARIPAIGRYRVVQVRFRIGPVPLRDDDIAFETTRARRRRWHLAGGDSIGPIGEHLEHAAAAEVVESCAHPAARLTRLNRAGPRRQPKTRSSRAPSGSRASPCCRSDGRRCTRPISRCAATAPGSAYPSRSRCRYHRYLGTRSCPEFSSGRASSQPGNTAPLREGLERPQP